MEGAGLRLGVRLAVTVGRRMRVMWKMERKMKSHLVQGMLQTPVTVSYPDSKYFSATLKPVQYA